MTFNDINVLNFESLNIEKMQEILRCGGEFFVDDLYNDIPNVVTNNQLDTSKIDVFINRISKIKNALSTISLGMNWLCEPVTDNFSDVSRQVESSLM